MRDPRGFDPASVRRLGVSEIARLAFTAGVLLWHCLRMVGRKLIGSKQAIVGQELCRAFERLGSTYIKFGQIIASSPGLFPVRLSDEFRSLLDHVQPVPYEAIRQVVTTELGKPLEEIFCRFDATPIASASIAQVHLAVLPGGEEVAVKVQRPGIRRQLVRDVRVLMLMARLLERVPPIRMVQPKNVVADFARTLSDELDFLNEAQAMERFEANLRRFGRNEGIRIPAVHHSLSRPRVLTMERIRGRGFADLVERGAHDFDMADVLKRVSRAWIEAAFEHGFFHGDMHAGNLMVDNEGNVAILDFGIMGSLDTNHRMILRKGLPRIFLDDDFGDAARAFYEMDAGVDPAVLDRACAELAEVLAPILSRPLADLSFAEIFVNIVQVGDRRGVELPLGMILIAKVLLYIDRYIKQMAPDWAMLSDTDLIWFLIDVEPSTADDDVLPPELTQDAVADTA